MDRYGLEISTDSSAARDAYIEGCDLLLSGNPGPAQAFDRAIASDPAFALAHAGKARAHQLRGEMAPAREAMAASVAAAEGLPAREASHVAFHELLLAGQSEAAVVAAKAHLKAWPRDAVVLGPCSSVFGLIGFSGRAGREIEQVELLDSLAPHYGDDGWFNGVHAFALMESGQRALARPKIERAIAQNPGNANSVHVRAHMYYEDGEPKAARAYLKSWLPSYSRDGLYHGHLTWHLALCELQSGDADEAYRLYTESLAPGVYRGPALFVVADAVSFLWRAELAGSPRDPARWSAIHEFAHRMFPHPAIAYADTHIALADAVTGNGEALEVRLREMEDQARQGKLPSGPVAPALSRAFAAFLRQDYAASIAEIEPVFAQHERIGGSRAQRDLVEFTLLKAYVHAGRLDDVRRMLRERRPGPAGIPVAGLPAMH